MQSIQKIYLFTLLMAMLSIDIQAKVDTESHVDINTKNFTKQGDSLVVALDFDLDRLNLATRDQVVFVPVIKSNNRELELPPLIINGNIRQKVYLRKKALARKRDEVQQQKENLRPKKGESQLVSYKTSVAYEEWMSTADLYLRESNCPGCGKQNTSNMRFLAPSTIPLKTTVINEPLPTVSIPMADTVTEHKTGSSFLMFEVGRSVINLNNKNNIEELNKLDKVLQSLLNDKNTVINSITITGFSSIEGSYSLNKRLSENRAKALQTYIEKKHMLPSKLFSTHWVGEDWDGLRKLVSDGDMEEKDKVLSIIDSTPIERGREKQLMNLAGGKPYLFMMKNYFPLLRRVDYRLEYDIRRINTKASNVK